MALTSKSLFVYGLEVTALNSSIDFQATSGGPILEATLRLGFYSPTTLALEVARAMQSVDAENNYFVLVNRNVLGGLQNRLTIGTNGDYLSLLFASGPNVNTSASGFLGYHPINYTGATSYLNAESIGSLLMSDYAPYNYLDDSHQGKVFGAVNVSASGLKESVVFNIQKFIDLEFKYEPQSKLFQWVNFFNWAIQQRPFDFTPEVIHPNQFYNVTLERSQYDSKGLGFRMKEMLPQLPNLYETGPLMFRITEESQEFI